MFGAGFNDRIVQRGIDEAFACQDMVRRAPAKPSQLSRVKAWFAATARALADRGIARRSPIPPALPQRSR